MEDVLINLFLFDSGVWRYVGSMTDEEFGEAYIRGEIPEDVSFTAW